MALTIKMRIDEQPEHSYVFSTGDGGQIELIPLSVVQNGSYTPADGTAYSLVTVNVPETELEHLNITANGTYTAEDGTAYDVVTVNVQPILDTLNETITQNGTYDFTPTNDGFDGAHITVDVPTSNIQRYKEVTITENGYSYVSPDSGYDAIAGIGVIASVQGSNFIGGTFVMQEGTNNIPDVYIPSGSKIAHVSVVLYNFSRISEQTIQRLCVAQEIYLAPNTASPYGYNAYLTRYGASGASLTAGTGPITASTGDIAISNERFVGLYNNRSEVRVYGTTLGTAYGGIVGETYRYFIVLE